VLFFAPTLGPVHRRCGQAFVWVVLFVSASGCALLADPAFSSIGLLFFSNKTHLGDVLKSSQYFGVMFLYFTLSTLYATVTGPRILARIRASSDGRITSSKLDWILALAALPLSLMFLAIGVIDVIHAQRFGAEFIFFSLVLDTFIIFDIATFVLRPSIRGSPWWMIHMVKMLSSFSTIVYAVYLRHFFQLPKIRQVDFFGVYLGGVLIGIYLFIHRRRLITGPSK